jgi:NAD(P)-dependent dehydrogenase (short-subunit alcohol dehydrogenase family)
MKTDKRIKWNRLQPINDKLSVMKVIIIGGAGSIGRALSRFMASHGADVTVVGQTFRDAAIPKIKFIKADLSQMKEAKRVGELLEAESANLIIFTNGIFASPNREETSEGIERDMAVSYLSRIVILNEIIAQLGKNTSSNTAKPRVFIMGYPGAGNIGKADDLNAEKTYKAMNVHLNTVAGNEMLVLDFAKKHKNINFYGLNPGLLPTNIRSNFLGTNSFKFRLMERIVSLISMSLKNYAETLTPLLISSDIENYSGAMFNQKGNAILPSADFTESHIHQFMQASNELIVYALHKK